MKLRTNFPEDSFEGDLTLELCGLPADAQIVRSVVKVTPKPFDERISLLGSPPYPWGITKDGNAVDFHVRRIVSQVQVPSATTGTVRVHIDMGGVWVTLNNDGTIDAPWDGKSREFAVSNGVVNTRNAVTSRIQVTQNDQPLLIQDVTWLSFPTNVSLRIGAQGPFWFQTGELRTQVTTPDFSEPLRAYLLDAQVENGHFVVPFTLHSDAIAQLEVELEIEYVRQQAVLPSGVKDVLLPFAYEPLPQADPKLLTVALPANARVLPEATKVRVVGTFEPSRIVLGPTTPVSSTAVVSVSSASQAQPISISTDLAANAIDLLLEPLTPTATVNVDLMGDADGKPWGKSLLSRPATVRLEQEVDAEPGWVSAPLPEEFQFQARGPDGRPRRYWLVVHSAQGEASWAVRPQTEDQAGLYCSQDDGLSWQATEVKRLPGALAGLFRLRYTPAQFQVPIQLQVGQGEKAQLVPLDRFQPTGRIDFTLDFPEVAEAFNQYVAEAAPTPCPEGEHLINSDFERWIQVTEDNEIPEAWQLTSGQVSQAQAFAYIAGTESRPGALSQVVPVAGGCRYQFEVLALVADDSIAEVIWLNESCGAVRSDQIALAVSRPSYGYLAFKLHRAWLQAPSEATQAEVRFIVPVGQWANIDRISLATTTETVVNGDLQERQEGQPTYWPAHWKVEPAEAETELQVSRDVVTGIVSINNTGQDDEAAALVQQIQVPVGPHYTLDFRGWIAKQPDRAIAQIELGWLRADGSPAGADMVQPIAPTGPDRYVVEGTVPADTTQIELRLVVPAQTIVAVQSVSLTFWEPTQVPVTFIAQAPGELTVSDLQIAYDRVPLPPPKVPETGLCFPTPPNREPGEQPGDCCYCPHCETERTMRGLTPAVARAGRPAWMGRCSTCGSDLVHFGGLRVVGVQARSLPQFLTSSRIDRSSTVPMAPTVPPETLTTKVDAKSPLAAISGIAGSRARTLEEIGINSLEKLATAAPEHVARALRGVSVETATGFIEEARRRLAAREKP